MPGQQAGGLQSFTFWHFSFFLFLFTWPAHPAHQAFVLSANLLATNPTLTLAGFPSLLPQASALTLVLVLDMDSSLLSYF